MIVAINKSTGRVIGTAGLDVSDINVGVYKVFVHDHHLMLGIVNLIML
jgi:hypothetical protein